MTKPSFSASVSLGNVLQILGLIAAAATGYALLEARARTNADAVDALRAEMVKIAAREENRRGAVEVRLRFLETSFARTDERFNAMMQLLQSIDGRLERIERKELNR